MIAILNYDFEYVNAYGAYYIYDQPGFDPLGFVKYIISDTVYRMGLKKFISGYSACPILFFEINESGTHIYEYRINFRFPKSKSISLNIHTLCESNFYTTEIKNGEALLQYFAALNPEIKLAEFLEGYRVSYEIWERENIYH